jgi:hypothetical protein
VKKLMKCGSIKWDFVLNELNGISELESCYCLHRYHCLHAIADYGANVQLSIAVTLFPIFVSYFFIKYKPLCHFLNIWNEILYLNVSCIYNSITDMLIGSCNTASGGVHKAKVKL